MELRDGKYEETAHVTGDEEYQAESPFEVTIVPSRLVVVKAPDRTSGTGDQPR